MRIILFVLLMTSYLFADPYELGQGLKVPKLPLYVGGYATLDYLKRKDDYNRFRVDELALLGYGDIERFSYLAEIEMKEVYVKEWGKIEREEQSTRINIERLYGTYMYNDTLSLRLGKFNTPAGYWNLEPVNVLRDSASNPYMAYIVYPRYTSGVWLQYADSLHNNNSYTLLAQENSDIDSYSNNISAKRHYMAEYAYQSYEGLRFKADLGHFLTTDDDPFYYGVVAAAYENDRFNISSEFGARRDEYRWSVPYAFYLQGVWRFEEHHDLIGRFEAYKIDEGALREEQIGVFGYTYRPIYPVTFKFEYQLHSYVNESQFHTTFAVMF